MENTLNSSTLTLTRKLMLLDHLNGSKQNPMSTTSIKKCCFLCRNQNIVKIRKGGGNSLWKESISSTFCNLFGLEWNELKKGFKKQLLQANYCETCYELVMNIEFLMNNIKALESRLSTLGDKAEMVMKLAASIKLEEPEFQMDLDPLDDHDTVDIGPLPFPNGTSVSDSDPEFKPFIPQSQLKSGRKQDLRLQSQTYIAPEALAIIKPLPPTTSPGFLYESSESEFSDIDPLDFDAYEERKLQKRKDWLDKWEPSDYNCLFCPKGFKFKHSLTSHYIKCHDENDLRNVREFNGKPRKIHPQVVELLRRVPGPSKKFKCTEPGCNAEFGRSEPLKDHVLRVHIRAEPEFCCILCPKKYYSNYRLRNHYSDNHKAEDLETEEAQKLNIEIDIRNLIQNPPLTEREYYNRRTCQYCGELVKNLPQHMKISHSEIVTRPKCTKYCGKIFQTTEEVEAHENIHKEIQHTWTCILCPMNGDPIMFQYKSQLEAHVLQTHEENAFRCSECPHVVRTQVTLEAHMKSTHGSQSEDNPKLELCDICGYKSRSVKGLSIHISRTHSKQSEVNESSVLSLKCDVEGCTYDLPFKDKKRLKRHMKLNHSTSPNPTFTCSICSKSFNSKAQLALHSTFHLNLRPFICDKCPAAFKSKKYLLVHVRSHEREGFKPRGSKKSRLVTGTLVPDDFM